MKKQKTKSISLKFKKREARLILDRLLVFRFIRQLHGRFWGITAMIGLGIGLGICFLIRPDLMMLSTGFSDFGNDVRTAPYFAGSVFFAAYGLWRWRNYVTRTLKHSNIFYYLLSLIIIGLYLVALMPASWKPWPYRIHLAGFILTGVALATLVIVDGLISKTRRTQHTSSWRTVRIVSFILIVIGGSITLASIPAIAWFDLTLVGELMMFAGFTLWIYYKTYLGEGAQSRLSIIAKKIGLLN